MSDGYYSALVSVLHNYANDIKYDTPKIRYHLEKLVLILSENNMKYNNNNYVKCIIHLKGIFNESHKIINYNECLNELATLEIPLLSERKNNTIEIDLNEQNAPQISGTLLFFL